MSAIHVISAVRTLNAILVIRLIRVSRLNQPGDVSASAFKELRQNEGFTMYLYAERL
jgi:hypothetical protein